MAPPLLISPWRCRINFLPHQASLASEVTAMGPTHFLLLCLFALVMPVLVVDISTPQQQPNISERFLKIAFLGPSMKSMPWVYYGSVELSGPAISLAVEEFTSRGWLGGMNVGKYPCNQGAGQVLAKWTQSQLGHAEWAFSVSPATIMFDFGACQKSREKRVRESSGAKVSSHVDGIF